jgi:hypothetical protein
MILTSTKIKHLVKGIFIGGAISLTSVQAQAGVSVFGYGSWNLLSYEVGPITLKGDYGFGGGLGYSAPLSSSMMLDLTAAYDIGGIKINTVRGTAAAAVGTGAVVLGGGKLGLVVGGYYYYSLEDGGESDYGALAGLKIKSGSLYFKPQFLYGLKKNSLDKNTMLAQLVVGYTFGGKK